MKILLVGEYSRLHNSLKEGLVMLGHEVVIVGTGDNFKNFDTDHSIYPKYIESNKALKLLHRVSNKLAGLNLLNLETAWRFKNLLPQLTGFDHIQLINSDAIEIHPSKALKLFKKLLEQNKQMSLLVCGDDTPVIEYSLSGKLKYSVMTPYLKDKSKEKYFRYSLKYISKPYRNLFEWVKHKSNVLITSDLDYEIPMREMGYQTTFIPNPINTDKLAYSFPDIDDKIVIFLGINRLSYLKKGIAYFEEALEIIQKRYAEKVEIIVTENVPYKEYIKLYDRAHILLDQVYGYDQGYNALEAMAKGKVVFTGAESEFTDYYNLTEPVAINALPNTDAIVKELSHLIENPEKIKAISLSARRFIESEHNYISIAERYVKVWI